MDVTDDIKKEKLNWFKDLVSKDFVLISGAIFLGIIVSSLGLVVAFFIQILIDDILPQGKKEMLTNGIIIISGILLLKQILSFIQQYLGILQSKRFNLRLISRFYMSLLKLPKHFFNKYNSGDFIARMNDTSSIQQAISHVINIQVINALTLIVSSIVLFFYSIKIGVIALLSLPCFLVISFLFSKKIIYGQIEVMEANALKETNYIATIQNTDFIKGANKEDVFSNINKMLYGNFQKKIFSLGKLDINVRNISEFVGTVFFVVLLATVSFMTVYKEITVGEFAAIITISSGMLPAIATLAFSHLQLLGAKVAFDRMYELISIEKEYDIEIDKEKMKHDDIYSIKFNDIYFSYNEAARQVLKGVSLEAKKGEITCIYGENGSGKSTILNLIQNFYKPNKGSLLINDININQFSLFNLRESISCVSQQTKLFNKTIIENICLDDNLDQTRKAITILDKFGFGKYFDKLPDGYNTKVHEGGTNLSGGQLQLVSFARAFYRDTKVLLLDEPTAALDRDTENFILHLLNEFKKDGIVIMVTHKLKPAKLANAIYILKDGEINVSGSHDELLLSSNLYSNSITELIN